jgi:regulator of RNase E activity RraA
LNPSKKRKVPRAKLPILSAKSLRQFLRQPILHKRGLFNQFLQGVFRLSKHSTPMVGQAFTLRHIPAREDIDNAAIFRQLDHPQRVAVETCPVGDILVMDCARDTTAASLGGILATRLQSRGVGGFVSDAGIRDSDYASTLDMPIYVSCRSAPTNLTRHHAIDINVPIGCGGVPVYPGDVILGDGDGVIVIPLERLEGILPEALHMEHYEPFLQDLVAKGRSVIGTYPATQETLDMYAEYTKSNPKPFGE